LYWDIRYYYRDFKRFAFALPGLRRKVDAVRELAALMDFPRWRAKQLANALVKVGAVRRTKGRLVWPDEKVFFSINLIDLPPDSGLENDVALAARTEKSPAATIEIIGTSKPHG
jgi:hypothetical protein